jgi:hypothetical protein
VVRRRYSGVETPTPGVPHTLSTRWGYDELKEVTPMERTISSRHALAIMQATEDNNMDAVAVIMLMLEMGEVPVEWVTEYNVTQYYKGK